jgi:hypothetical protein
MRKERIDDRERRKRESRIEKKGKGDDRGLQIREGRKRGWRRRGRERGSRTREGIERMEEKRKGERDDREERWTEGRLELRGRKVRKG